MKEANLRKWHRDLGIILAVFVVLQAGSGLWITIIEIETPHSHANSEAAVQGRAHGEGQSTLMKSLSFIHHGAGSIGVIYRILLGIALLFMAVTGALIYLRIKARTRGK